jgi:nucleotide-binding universal stress UspA family protein
MFSRILVPTDSTEQLAKAMPMVRHLAQRSGASVVFVCVEPRMMNMGDVVDNRASIVVHADHLGTLESAVEELQRAGIDAHYDVEFGRPRHGISTAAKYYGSDLIVMAPQHRDGFDALLHPSITERMFSTAPAPVLTLPQQVEEAPPAELLSAPDAVVLVPLDGSPLAERALPFATACAQLYQRGMHLVRVVAPAPPDASSYSDAYEHAHRRYQAAVEEARRDLRAAETRVRTETGLPVQAELAVGEPADEIVDIARESGSDLIVMSTHGYGTVGRLLLGSVAAEVMRSATVPVVIVPPHAPLPQMVSTQEQLAPAPRS